LNIKPDARTLHSVPPDHHATSFVVEAVESFARFTDLRAEWDALHQLDPQSHVFLSWAWMAQALRDHPKRWRVLVVRVAGTPGIVCILPLKYRTHWSRSRQQFETELQAGGRLLWSEYTGFLCAPAYETPALTAVAQHLATMPWRRLSMRYVPQAGRSRVFTDALKAAGCDVRYKPYRINGGTTDNLLCPRVTLPADFATYLATQISASRRQQYSRFRRKYLETGDYRITASTSATLEADLDALLGFWLDKWRDQKGAKVAAQVAANYRAVLTAAHEIGALYLPVLRKGDEPLGALGHVVDARTGAMHFIVAGRSGAAPEPFIGAALHFHAISEAINAGCATYDFCHGDEAYKYSYGAVDLEVQ